MITPFLQVPLLFILGILVGPDGLAGVAETGSYAPNSLPFLFGHTVSLIFPASFSVIYGPVVEFLATACRWIDVYSRNI